MKFELKLKERLENYRRVLVISKKPNAEEFSHTAKITALGLALIGLIGFVFFILSILFIG
jgi:protein transport protein SEC61 subunit gamma-like protein